MSFLGKDVSLNIFSPNLDTPIISRRIATVSQELVEFNDNANFDITDPNDGFAVLNTNINIKSKSIVYTIDDAGGRFTNNGNFNGFVISDVDNNIRDIIGVSVAAGGNDLGISADNITFTANAIFVNVAGLSYSRGDRLVLLVEFRQPTPGPIVGTDADDELSGGTANNRIAGRAGSDILDGNSGADSLAGEEGSDVLIGGKGQDTLHGGVDADRFEFNRLDESQGRKADFILDFVQGIDKIDLRSIDANHTLARNQAFTLVGDEGFTGNAGELSLGFFNSSGTRNDRTLVAADVDGDSVADMIIKVKFLIELTSDDFIL